MFMTYCCSYFTNIENGISVNTVPTNDAHVASWILHNPIGILYRQFHTRLYALVHGFCVECTMNLGVTANSTCTQLCFLKIATGKVKYVVLHRSAVDHVAMVVSQLSAACLYMYEPSCILFIQTNCLDPSQDYCLHYSVFSFVV